MIKFIEIMTHIWTEGHSIDVVRYVNANIIEAGTKGWHYKCEYGKEWSR